MNKKLVVSIFCIICVCLTQSAFAGAAKTQYPVIFAHGSFGFDEVLGVYYFGDDYGTFVGDPCDCPNEPACNTNINKYQKAYATKVLAFQSSDVRGQMLFEQIEDIMAIENTTHVNVIAHSQGGVDVRKAAKLLYETYGYRVINVIASISSNHRGCPLGESGMNLGTSDPALSNLLDFLLEDFYGDTILNMQGNDLQEMFRGVMYDDYDNNDGRVTGVKDFNIRYPVDSRYASLYVSFMTAQNGLSRNPLISVFTAITGEIDGDGYCGVDAEGNVIDGDGDGAAGCGDGNPYNRDDDGLIGINSQQMGWRMKYYNIPFFFDVVQIDSTMGYVGDLNRPTQTQMTSLRDVIDADHFDPIFISPDLFDEMEFYASIIDFIAKQGG